jgi:hypothetical protein
MKKVSLKCKKNLKIPKGQSIMDKPETQATLGKRHRTKTNRTKSTSQRTKKMSKTDPTKKLGVNPGQYHI